MADVDDFITRHRQRLAEHRRELDDVEGESAAPPAADHRHQHHQSSEGYSYGGDVGDDDVAYYHQQQHHDGRAAADPKGNTWADAGRTSARRDESAQPHQAYVPHAGPSSAAARGAQGSPARSSTSSRYMREYVVDSPTCVYDRSQRWASQRDKAVAKQREEKTVHETADCTFQPSRQAATPSRSARGRSSSGAPKLTSNSDSPRVDAASYYQHIQRQEGARRDKEDQQRKVAVDTRHWRNRTTTPQEFAFGQRPAHIASLRKPCVGLTPRAAAEASARAWGDEPAHAEADDIDLSEDETTAAAARAAPPAAGRHHHHHQQQQQPRTARQATASASSADTDAERANADIVKLTKEVMLMRAKSERQEEEIARLGGTVVSLKRELDAAKGKLRHYALGGD